MRGSPLLHAILFNHLRISPTLARNRHWTKHKTLNVKQVRIDDGRGCNSGRNHAAPVTRYRFYPRRNPAISGGRRVPNQTSSSVLQEWGCRQDGYQNWSTIPLAVWSLNGFIGTVWLSAGFSGPKAVVMGSTTLNPASSHGRSAKFNLVIRFDNMAKLPDFDKAVKRFRQGDLLHR